MIAKRETLAQVSLVGEARCKEQIFGALIRYINERFNTMQPQFVKPKRQNGRHRFGYDASPLESAIEFITSFGAMKSLIEMKENAGANRLVFAF